MAPGAIRAALAVFTKFIAATPGWLYPVTAIEVDAMAVTVELSGAVAASVAEKLSDELFQDVGNFSVTVTLPEDSAARLPSAQFKLPLLSEQTGPPLQLI